MPLCNRAIDGLMFSQRPRLMETMGVSYEASNNRKQSMDNVMMWCVSATSPIGFGLNRLNHSESNFDLHKHE